MSNLKHYIKGISTGNTYFSLAKKFRFLTTILGIYQILMAVAYYFMGIYALMVFSVLMAIFFLTAINKLIKKESFTTAVIFSICAVVIISFASTICVGFEAGFSLYIFGAIAAIFYTVFVIESFQKKEFVPFLFSAIFLLCYVFNYIMMLFIPPFYTLNESWTNTLHIANSVVTIMIVIIFNLLFLWEIKARNTMLSTQNQQLDEMANIDPLTHLMNRRCMTGYLQKSMDILKTQGKRFSLILGDIDDFKHVNDTYGHDAGDLILVNVANIIKECLRSDDVVCRWGGEEILILITDPVETASMAAERIRHHLENYVTNFEGQAITVTMTFGIAESIPGYKIEQLIKQADDKLYQGKKNGKNCVVI